MDPKRKIEPNDHYQNVQLGLNFILEGLKPPSPITKSKNTSTNIKNQGKQKKMKLEKQTDRQDRQTDRKALENH